MRQCLWTVLCVVVLSLGACRAAPTATPVPSPLPPIPAYNPDSDAGWQVDLRGRNLSALDLRGSVKDLLYADFDSRTVWPPAERMPGEFDWQRIMALGTNPGLGVRSLHARGITGRGVSIAIVDLRLLTGHQEYANRLKLYEQINLKPNGPMEMHGAAVASIAVGKTVGVAPEASLYYIGLWAVDEREFGDIRDVDFRYYAQAVRRLLEVNKELPEGQKIRAIAMQIGWDPRSQGYEEIKGATEEAKAAGMLVVSSSLEEVHGFKFHGLGRAPLADPDRFESYEPGLWWAKAFYRGQRPSGRLLVPMDSRCTAGPDGTDEYAFYRQGGWSWSIPYIAGLYALAAQVDPTITPDRFWSLALRTGRTIQLQHEGQTVPLGPIVDPVALIESLGKGTACQQDGTLAHAGW